MAYSIDPSGDSCYPGTSVLVNKLGIQNQAQLDENETLIVGVKSLQSSPWLDVCLPGLSRWIFSAACRVKILLWS